MDKNRDICVDVVHVDVVLFFVADPELRNLAESLKIEVT